MTISSEVKVKEIHDVPINLKIRIFRKVAELSEFFSLYVR
jgi:hypothetical protein